MDKQLLPDTTLSHYRICPKSARAEWAHSTLALSYLKQGRNAEAITHLERAAELSNRDAGYLMELGYGYGATGQRAEATATVKDLEAKYARKQSNAMYAAAVYSALGQKDKAFEWLEKAFDAKEDLGLIRWRIFYESLREDPRARNLLKRTGLPE